ncbi:hypothetical protein ACFWP5_43115 [Streptomyces sp. NPDC058469]|uniref:hypothetical protein n=1 Tax=Streptomyces sp. NPDC058469 TaxID=3346514 RepID=UPI003666A1BE
MADLHWMRGGTVSGRPATPEPDAAWATVYFRAAPPGEVLRGDGSDDRASFVDWRSDFVVWRSDAAHGSALVRSDPLPSSAERHAYPYPPLCPHAVGPLPCDVHLWVDADSPGRTELMEHADVLVSRVPLPLASAHRRVRGLLAGHPGCLAAAVLDTTTRCVVGVRDRTGAVSFVRPERGGSDVPLPPHVVVSVVHAWAVSGGSPRALRSVVAMPRR